MITIFTPTYNRKEYLSKLKKSLDEQTDKHFEWLIVDDGSCDGTEEEVKAWKSNVTDYKIKYTKQKNQGKHIAFNLGVKLAGYNWIICVDSDDTLDKNAVKIINHDIKTVSSKYIGIVYPKIMKNEPSKSRIWEKIDHSSVDIMELKDFYKIRESTIVMKKNIIQNIPFPKYDNEKFLAESWLYQKLTYRGKFLALNKSFYISEYLDTGLTKNIWKVWKENPKGILEILKEKYKIVSLNYRGINEFIVKLKCIININSLCIATGKNIFTETPSKFMSFICYLPSLYVFYTRYK